MNYIVFPIVNITRFINLFIIDIIILSFLFNNKRAKIKLIAIV